MAENKDKKKNFHSVVSGYIDYVPKDYNAFVSALKSDPALADRLYSDLVKLEAQGYVNSVPAPDDIRTIFTGTTTTPTTTTETEVVAEEETPQQGTPARTFPTPQQLKQPVTNQPLPNVGVQPQTNQPRPTATETQIAPIDQQAGQVQGGQPISGDVLANAPRQEFQWSGQAPTKPVVQPQTGMPQTPEQGMQQGGINPADLAVSTLGSAETSLISQIGSELKGIAETGYSLDKKIVSALEGTPFEGGYVAPYSKPEDSWIYQAGQGLQNFTEEYLYRNPEYAGGILDVIAQGTGSVGAIALTGGLSPAGGVMKLGTKAMTNPQLIAYGASQLFKAPMIRGAFAMVGQETDSARQLHRMANQMDKDAYVVERMALGEDKEDAGKAWETLRTKTEDEVAESMILPGVFAGVTEAIPLERLLVRLGKPAQNIVLNAFKQGGIQGAEEATQEVIQQTIINAGIGNTYNEAQKLTTGLMESAEGGGATGFVLGAVLTALVGKRANIKQRVQAGEITPQEAIAEMEDINKAEKLVQDKLEGLSHMVDSKVVEEVAKVTQLPEAETFFESNEASLTNPLVTMPKEVESVFDKIADGILVSPESLHTAYQWVNDNFKGIMQNKALSDAEKGATLNIFNGMLSDIDKANTEGQAFVEQVEEVSVQDRVPAKREADLPKGQKPGEPQTLALDQAKQIREENRRKQAGTTTLPSSGQTIITPAPATTEVATEAVTETPTETTAEAEVKLAELPTKTIEAEVVSETPVAGAEANPALADVESTAKALEGVDATKLGYIKYEDAVVVEPQVNFENLPEGVDELSREARSRAMREQEKKPPKYTKYPIGTIAVDRFGEVYELKDVPLEDAISKDEGTQKKETIDKYVNWIEGGNEMPPVKGVENFATEGGKVKITDGNHRYQAAKKAGLKTIPIWVALTDKKNVARPVYANNQISSTYHSAKAKPESERTAQETELITKVEKLLTPTQDAVSLEKASSVPVQSGTTSSQEVAKGEPKAEPQSTTDKGQAQATATQEEVGATPTAETIGQEGGQVKTETEVKYPKFFKKKPKSRDTVIIDIDKVKKEKPKAYEFLKKYKGHESFEPKDIVNALAIAYNRVMKYESGAKNLSEQISELEDLAEYLSPVRKTTKEEFKKQAKKSGDFSEKQLEIFNALVDSLDTEFMPEYNSHSSSLAFVGIDAKNAPNFYSFSENILSAKKPEAFIHEIGHFSFYNILSKADRLKFLEYMIKSSYGEDAKSLGERLAMTSEKLEVDIDGQKKTFGVNVADNFSEYFAEQFRQWYLKERTTPKEFDSIFEKVAKVLDKLIDKLRNGQYVDKNLIDYFEKISPLKTQSIPESKPLTPINATDVETITKIENATEKGRELALNKPTNKGLKRAFEAFKDLSDRARKAGIYDGKTLKIGGQEIEVDTPAKFKAFLANQGNFDALSEAVKGVESEQKTDTNPSPKTVEEKSKEVFNDAKSTFVFPIGLNPKFKFDSRLPENVVRFFKKYFRPRGLWTKGMFSAKRGMENQISAQQKRTEFAVKDLKQAVNEAYPKGITNEQLSAINDTLQGYARELPANLYRPIEKMREHIDELSRLMISEGIIDERLVPVFDANMGIYTTRTYAIHNDPEKWIRYINEQPEGQQIRNNAVNFVRQATEAKADRLDRFADENEIRAEKLFRRSELAEGDEALMLQAKADEVIARADKQRELARTMREQDFDAQIDAFLFAEGQPLDIVRKGNVGAKDLGVLKKRKNIPDEFRALMGKEKDPLTNYTMSVAKMSALIANNQFLNEVKAQGLASGLFSKQTPQGKNVVKIASASTDSMSPLNGIYTTKDIAEAFKEFDANTKNPWYVDTMLWVNAVVKIDKTVLSEQAVVRNFLGNPIVELANGYIPTFKGRAINTQMEEILNRRFGDRADVRGYIERLTKLGVLGQGGNYREIQAIYEDLKGKNYDYQKLIEPAIKKAGKATWNVLQKIYKGGDEFWKVVAFENERAVFKKAYGDTKTDEELDEMTATKIRRTRVDYSMAPKAVKVVNKFPFAGTFVTFPAEIIRIGANIPFVAYEEMNSGNKVLRDHGIKRMAGYMTAMTLSYGLSELTRYLAGMDDEEEEARKQFLAPWTQNSTLVWIDKNTYVDTGFSDAFSILKKPIVGFIRGADFVDGSIQAVKEFLGPLISEEIGYKTYESVKNNRDEYDNPIYDENAEYGTKGSQIASYVLKKVEPGTVSQIRRLYLGETGALSEKGQKYSTTDEITNATFGIKRVTVDWPNAVSFKFRDGVEKINNSNKFFLKATKELRKNDVEGRRKAAESTNLSIENNYNDLRKYYTSALKIGMLPKNVEEIMRESGVSNELINAVVNNTGYNNYLLILNDGTVLDRQAQKQLKIKR